MVDGGGQVQSLQPAGARPVRKPWRPPEETGMAAAPTVGPSHETFALLPTRARSVCFCDQLART